MGEHDHNTSSAHTHTHTYCPIMGEYNFENFEKIINFLNQSNRSNSVLIAQYGFGNCEQKNVTLCKKRETNLSGKLKFETRIRRMFKQTERERERDGHTRKNKDGSGQLMKVDGKTKQKIMS